MGGGIKIFLYIILAVIITSFFFYLLPYILLTGLVIWLIFKLVGFFKGSKYKKKFNDERTTYTERSYSFTTVDNDEEEAADIIDVDYEDIDK